jgi:predicted RNA-binding Zn-ribbon protein involved in translation (DUF1610 family)
MKTLLLDIETSPNIGYTWGLYEQNVIEFIDEWKLLSVAYKWLDKDKVYAVGATNGLTEKDVLKEIHKAMSLADICIMHNGDRFDVRKLNARFVYHELPPPEPYKTIDTLKVARKYFAFNSNKLTDLGKHLGLGEKVQTGGFQLWKDCMAGDERAFKKMIAYNKQDVVLLEKIYLKLRPYMTNHPNVNVLDDNDDNVLHCPACGQTRLQRRGFGTTISGKYQRYQCKDCGYWSRGRTITTVNIK